MSYFVLLPLLTSAITIAITLASRSRTIYRLAPMITSTIIFLSGIILVGDGQGAQIALGGILRIDAISAWMLMTVGAVGTAAMGAGLKNDVNQSYSVLLNCFVAAMTVAVEADNIGFMWFAIEATTVATAFLVSKSGTRRAAEAAWKYVVLASSGIAIALLGIVIIFGASQGRTLSWIALMHDHHLNQGLLRLGLALTILGFATKVGLFPMHSWLPDAHSQSPSTVSALMSGVLLSVALYVIIRMRLLGEFSSGNSEFKGILIFMGITSLALASLMMVRQRDIKRLLAYSSIEHMGVMVLGVAVGKVAIAAVLTYILAHGLLKAPLFILAGRVVDGTGTSDIATISQSGNFVGRTKILTIVGLVGLLGLPPFAIFFAEISISISGFSRGLGIYIAVAFIFTLIAFSSIIRSISTLAFPVTQVSHKAINESPYDPLSIDHSRGKVSVVAVRTDLPSKESSSIPLARKSRHSSDVILAASLLAAVLFPFFLTNSQRSIEVALSLLTGVKG